MAKLNLANYAQGVRGGKGKSNQCGYSLLTAQKDGHNLVQISMDTFEGVGQHYKERENIHIEIYFPGFANWTGTPDELKKILTLLPL